jgi:class 3 adenylate cyclase/tetratricopeptide (TPR) repeat protein
VTGGLGPPHEAEPPRRTSIDELLDRAVLAINRGDRATATALAGQVLAVDEGNAEAEDLLAAPGDAGEIRRLTLFFADLVDSTVLSTRVEPETYRLLVGRYREMVLRIVKRYEGHIGSTKGDGLLAVFGHPVAHEDDVRRAVQAGLDITREVARLSEQAKRRLGIEIKVRVGVHRGLVYLDTAQDDVYGLAANLSARVSGLAPPGSVVVSDAVEALVRNDFEFEERPPAPVKGVEELITHFRVVGEQAAAVSVNRGPLVGRERELTHLEKFWKRAQTDRLTVPGVVFRGEPGIGKSRLAAAAAELVERDRGAVLELIGSPFHTEVGLHPVRTFLERQCGISRLTDAAERIRLLEREIRARSLETVTTVPLLAPVLGIAPEHGYEPVPAEGHRLQQLITAGVHDYLLACSGAAPGLLIAEDLHWFDSATIDLLGTLLRADTKKLLMVLTGRADGWLPTDWPVTVFDLAQLTDEQTDALVLALDPTASADQRALVRARCDGVPFYVEQVVAGPSSGAEAAVPEMLYEPLFARLRASRNAVPVVEAAAIIGRDVDRALLIAVSGLTEGDLDEVIDDLEDARVLEACGDNTWRFRHELLRELAAELAPPSVRRSLHGRIADALLLDRSAGDADWRIVGAHYERAERYEEAASAYQRASADARLRGALAEALTYLTHAISHLDHETQSAQRDRHEIALRLERGFLAASVHGISSDAAAADFEQCLQLGGTNLRDDDLFATLVALTNYYAARADLDRLTQLLDVLHSDQGRRWFTPVIEALYGVVGCLRGDYDSARRRIELANQESATSGREIDTVWFMPNDPIATAQLHLAWALLVQGDLDRAHTELDRAADRVERLAFPQGPYSLGFVRFMQIWTRIEAGQLDRAAEPSADLTDQAERLGLAASSLFAATQRATVNAVTALTAHPVNQAELSQCLASMTTSVATWRTIGMNLYTTFFDAVIARLQLALGQHNEARRRLDTGLQLAEDTGMHFYDAELLRLRGHTYMDSDARATGFHDAVQMARRQGAHLFELRSALDDFALRGGAARSGLLDALNRMPGDSELPELERARAALNIAHDMDSHHETS